MLSRFPTRKATWPMTSLLDERLGLQEPTILHSPPDVVSLAAADEAIQLADAYGICDGNPLSESQRITLRNALGERADHSWAATRVADFGPRQGTGKNDKIAARELAGLILFGERLQIHTAHEFPTANESFLRLVSVFENWDDLRSRVARIRYANGEQGIELLSGQRLKYRARTGGSGRGFAKADLIVYDEAQHLAREHTAASGPTKMANPNSQTWYAGSGGLSTSAKAWQIRREALSGDAGRLAYTEMTGEVVSLVNGRHQFSMPDDVLDRDVWYACIPGLGRWVSEEGVMAQYEDLGPEMFAREILCVWDPDPNDEANATIDIDAWDRLTDAKSEPVSDVRVSFDMTPDRKRCSFGLAGRRADGVGHVEERDSRVGTGWVVDRALELATGHGCPITVAKGSPGAAFIDLFERAGVPVDVMSSAENVEACGRFIDAARLLPPAFRHLGDVRLRSAILSAQVKPAGDAFVWSRRSSAADITPLTTATMAWGRVGDGVTEPAPVFAA